MTSDEKIGEILDLMDEYFDLSHKDFQIFESELKQLILISKIEHLKSD